jgi:hypothetical protein
MFSTKLKIAAGVLGLGGLLLATPYVERSSSILNYDNHCLRVLQLGPNDSISDYQRGTIADFYFVVVEGIGKFETSFRVNKFVGENTATVEFNNDSKKSCLSKLNSAGLLEFVKNSETSSGNDCKRDYYKFDAFIDYISPDNYAPDMEISCKSDASTPNCSMYILTDRYWLMNVLIEKSKLPYWREVYAAAQSNIKSRLEALDFCPIEVPFL